MITLGINDGHDAGACLMQDGAVLLHSSEERRRNSKNYAGIPDRSISTVFQATGIDPRDVDLITLSSTIRTTVPTREYKPIYSVLQLLWSLGRTDFGTKVGRWLLSRLRRRRALLDCLDRKSTRLNSSHRL